MAEDEPRYNPNPLHPPLTAQERANEEARKQRTAEEVERTRRAHVAHQQAEMNLAAGRKAYEGAGGSYYRGGQGDAAGAGAGRQVIVVRQQPPWTGPPIGPIRLPKRLGGRPLPGAANAVFVLGFGLAAVASWQPLIKPLLKQAWYVAPAGQAPAKVAWPGGAVLALPLFVLLLVFIASLSPDAAQVTMYFLLALWAVFLVMNPSLVQGAMAFFTQRNPTTGAIGPAGPPQQPAQGTKGGATSK